MDYRETAEEEAVEPEASQEKEIEQLPAESSQKPVEEASKTEPASLEPDETESEPAQLEPQSPPPVVEAHAADEGDEVPAADPLAKPEPQKTLDLFEEEPPAPQHTTSQVRGLHILIMCLLLSLVVCMRMYESLDGVVSVQPLILFASGTS